MRVDPARRAVGIDVERHRAHAAVHLDLPGGLLGREVHDVEEFVPHRPGDRVLAIRRDIGVVHAPVHRDRLLQRELRRVDDVEPERLGQRDDDAPAVIGHRDVVGAAAQVDLLDDLAGLLVHHVERVVGFVAEVDALAVGREADAVRGFHAVDYLHHLVGNRIDDADLVAGGVGGVDAHRVRRRRGQRRKCQQQPERRGDGTGELAGWIHCGSSFKNGNG